MNGAREGRVERYGKTPKHSALVQLVKNSRPPGDAQQIQPRMRNYWSPLGEGKMNSSVSAEE